MKQVCQNTASRRLAGDVFETRGREVSEKDLAATRRLAADVFRKVPNGHVHGICGLVAENSELGLVRGYDDGDNGCPGLLLLKLLLQNELAMRLGKALVEHTCVSHHHRPVCMSK